MDPQRASELAEVYRKELQESVIPFWAERCPDPEYGGFFSCFDREGNLYDTTKNTWVQGRCAYMFARLYDEVEARDEWLAAARRGIDFINRYCFDEESGRMHYTVSREGKRLTRPWTIFSECFALGAMCQYSKVTGQSKILGQAQQLFDQTLELANDPTLDSCSYPEASQSISHAIPMILLNVTQQLRQAGCGTAYQPVADEMLQRILNLHLHPEHQAIFEYVAPDGSLIEGPMGRVINPGHALESMWFVLHEARDRGDEKLRDQAVETVEWSIARGWDEEFGGIFYFLDYEGSPSPFLEWDMKLWWVHIEALYALLLAHHLSGRDDLLAWFERVHSWTWEHFPDRQYGGWLGYLHRRGDIASTAKGNMWKSFYHVPRGLLLIWKLLQEIASRTSG